MCNKSYLTRLLCVSWYFIYRVLNFFVYDAVPLCDTQLPVEHGNEFLIKRKLCKTLLKKVDHKVN